MYSNSVQLLQSSLMTHVESTQHVSEHFFSFLKPNCFHWATSFMQSIRSVYGTVSFKKYVYCSQKNPCAMHLRAVGQAGGHGEGASTSQSFHRIQSAHGLWSQIKSSPVQGLPTKTKATLFQRYVFSSGGTSCMVTAVDPLFVLNCSKRFSSTLLSSALGSWTVFSKAGLELPMPPDTEGTHRSFIGTLLWPTDGLIFWRGLEPVVPRTLDTWVRLLYVFRMINNTARMMMMPMTMTAIIAPELWMSICSLDFVTTVVLGVVVMLVTGDSFEACIFSNNQTHSSWVSASRWEPEQLWAPSLSQPRGA